MQGAWRKLAEERFKELLDNKSKIPKMQSFPKIHKVVKLRLLAVISYTGNIMKHLEKK